MVGEVRAFLRKSSTALDTASEAIAPQKAQFDKAVDQAGKVMAQTGKMTQEDISRATGKMKDAFELFLQEKDLEWNDFVKEVGAVLENANQIDKESFQQSVDQAKQKLHEQLESVQGFGEEQQESIEAYLSEMSTKAEGMWEQIKSSVEEGEQKIDRAIEAAAEELKK
jgi:hypothetical protein